MVNSQDDLLRLVSVMISAVNYEFNEYFFKVNKENQVKFQNMEYKLDRILQLLEKKED